MASNDDLPTERADDDDYDLLTYGEAGARLAELLNTERQRLDELSATPGADPKEVEALRKRIELLRSSADRYRQHSASADKFTETFGFDPRPREKRGKTG